jgi:hypothetical protein
MSVVFHTPEMRLTKLIRTPGGKPVAEAVRDAGAGLVSLQGDCLKELANVLDQCDAIFARAAGGYDAAVANELYERVSATVGLATTCNLAPIDTMLVSMADLLDYLKEREAWEANALAVHLRAFRLLLHTEAARDGTGTEAILDGLRKVSQRFARPPAGETHG